MKSKQFTYVPYCSYHNPNQPLISNHNYIHTDRCNLIHCLGQGGEVLQSQQQIAVEQPIYSQAHYRGVTPRENPLPKEAIREQLDCLPELALVELEMEGGGGFQLSVGESTSRTEVNAISHSSNSIPHSAAHTTYRTGSYLWDFIDANFANDSIVSKLHPVNIPLLYTSGCILVHLVSTHAPCTYITMQYVKPHLVKIKM